MNVFTQLLGSIHSLISLLFVIGVLVVDPPIPGPVGHITVNIGLSLSTPWVLFKSLVSFSKGFLNTFKLKLHLSCC